jgi:hypothetical protein
MKWTEKPDLCGDMVFPIGWQLFPSFSALHSQI